MDSDEEVQGKRLLQFTSAVLLPVFCATSLAACSLVTGPKHSASVFLALTLTGHGQSAQFTISIISLNAQGWSKPLSLGAKLGGKLRALCINDRQLSYQERKVNKSVFGIFLSWMENLFFHFILVCGLYCIDVCLIPYWS